MPRRGRAAIAGHPAAALTAGLGALLVLAAPAIALHLGQTDAGDAPRSTEERRVFDLMAEGFGPGSDAQLALVLTGVQRDEVGPIERIVDALEADPGHRAAQPTPVDELTFALAAMGAVAAALEHAPRLRLSWSARTSARCSAVAA